MGWVDRLAELSIRPNMDLLKPNAGRRTIISVLYRNQPLDKGLNSLCQANIHSESGHLTNQGSAHTSVQLINIRTKGDVCPEGIFRMLEPALPEALRSTKVQSFWPCARPTPAICLNPPLHLRLSGPFQSSLPGLCWTSMYNFTRVVSKCSLVAHS